MTSDHTVVFRWHGLAATRTSLMFEPPPFELAACRLPPQTKRSELHALLLPAPRTASGPTASTATRATPFQSSTCGW